MAGTAPLTAIAGAPVPDHGTADWFSGADGSRLRAALFLPPETSHGGKPRGSVVVNPGRSAARAAAKKVDGCDFVTPIFAPATREQKDTDFNDLHVREGLDAVRRQLSGVITAMQRRYG